MCAIECAVQPLAIILPSSWYLVDLQAFHTRREQRDVIK